MLSDPDIDWVSKNYTHPEIQFHTCASLVLQGGGGRGGSYLCYNLGEGVRQYSSSVIRVQKVLEFRGIAVLYTLRGVYCLNKKCEEGRLLQLRFAPFYLRQCLLDGFCLVCEGLLLFPLLQRNRQGGKNVIRDRNILISLYE